MGFLLHGTNSYIFFVFYAEGKKCRYSTKIKLDRSEWDLATQRPKPKRGNIGEANRKITDELNEYQSYYNELKSKFKESLTKEKIKQRFDQYFHLAQVVKTLRCTDYLNIFIQQKEESQSLKKDSLTKYTNLLTAVLEMEKKNNTIYHLRHLDKTFLHLIYSLPKER